MQARIDTAQWVPASLFGAAAVALGMLAGLSPAIAVAASLALTFALITFVDLAAGLSVFAIISFAEFLRIGDSPLLSGTKIAGVVLALSWLATLTTRTSERSRTGMVVNHRGFVYLAIVFGAFAVLSNQWAEDLGEGSVASFGYIVDLALFPIVYAAISERKHVVWILGAFVAGAVLSALHGMILPPPPESSPEAIAAEGRLIGAGITPNYLAAILVSGLVLSAGLFAIAKRSPLQRLTLAFAAFICVAGLLLTLSRTGLVALAVCLLASLIVARGRRGSAAVVALVVAVATVGYFGFWGPPEARDRVQSVESSGRLDLWTVGWRMVEDRPVAGVGAGNFPVVSARYLRAEPGGLTRGDLIIEDPRTVHNMYLEVMAELGVIGFTLFVAIILFAVSTAARAGRNFFLRGDTSMDTLSRAVFIAQIGMLVAACFASIQFLPQLWLLLALGPALLALSTRPDTTTSVTA